MDKFSPIQSFDIHVEIIKREIAKMDALRKRGITHLAQEGGCVYCQSNFERK